MMTGSPSGRESAISTRLTAYDASEWTELFVATAGASAALAGLVFVAVSINVDRILKLPGIPERALETVLLLLSVVLISIVGLIPSQSNDALGIELLALAITFGVVIGRLERRSLPQTPQPPSEVLMRIFLIVAATLPMVVGGASLLAESGGGLYWIVAGIVFATAGAVANAWVLMVEILR
jgi:modulator of FtsH protease